MPSMEAKKRYGKRQLMVRFVMVSPAIMTDSRLGHLEFRTLVKLFAYRNAKSGKAWPSGKRMCAEMGISQSALRRTIKGLKDKGWIVRVENSYHVFEEPVGAPAPKSNLKVATPRDAIQEKKPPPRPETRNMDLFDSEQEHESVDLEQLAIQARERKQRDREQQAREMERNRLLAQEMIKEIMSTNAAGMSQLKKSIKGCP